jgi:hypothetical protein
MPDDKDVMPIELPSDEELFLADDTEPEADDDSTEVVEAQEEGGEPAKEEPDEVKEDHRVPLTELLNEREKRQRVEAEYQSNQQQWEQWRQQYEAAQAQQNPTEAPDIFENPEYYQNMAANLPAYINNALQQQGQQHQQQMAMQRMEVMGEMSLRAAYQQEPETYDTAWGELQDRMQRGDQTWRQAMLQSQDPGRALIDLYKQDQAVKIGSDPDAYRQKIIEELRANPEMMAEALGATEGGPNVQPSRVNIPQSLTKAGGSGHGPLNISGHDLWNEINK